MSKELTTVAKLAQLAAMAKLTQLKAEGQKHWEGELHEEICKIANLANELVEDTKRGRQ